MSSSDGKKDSSSTEPTATTASASQPSPPKSKPQISALEKYGFITPSKLQTDDNDDDYDDDDYVDDYDDVTAEDGITETEETETESTVLETAETEETEDEEEGEVDESVDNESYFDTEDGHAGDWHVTSKTSENESEAFDEEEEIQSRREKRFSSIRHQKEILIIQYLTLMKHLGRTRRKNMYLQDYLYKLCFRKNLIKEPSELQSTVSANQRSASRLKRQKKKLNAKMAANYEALVKSKPPDVWSPLVKADHKPTRGELTRGRRIVQGEKRPPNYMTKLETKYVSIGGTQYQRLLRSASRNWPENVEQDETKNTLQEMNQQATKTNIRKEIPHGIPGAPKRRVLVEVIEPVHDKIRKKQSLIKKKDDNTGLEGDADGDPKAFGYKNACKGKNCRNKKNSRKSTRQSRIGNPKNVRIKTRRSGKVKVLRESDTRDGAGAVRRVQIQDNGTKKSMNFNRKFTSRRMFKIPKKRCRRKKNNKPFREFHWFDERGKLKGRQFSGTKLLSAEKQHLINFVNSAVLSSTSREKSRKLKKQRQLNSTELDWKSACNRLFHLILKKEELENQHAQAMQRKFVGWGLWENRNMSGVEGLLTLFKTFVQQQYFSRGELRRFIPDLDQFDQLLQDTHTKLMDQLIKMYKSRLSLLLVQRKLKDKTDQTLNQQGFSIGFYEQLSLENKSLYEKVQDREQSLDKQKEKLASIMKNLVLTRDFKGSVDTKVKNGHYRYEVVVEECQRRRNRALEVIDKLVEIMKKNTPMLLQSALVEKSHLLHDFTTRKQCLENLEARKRKLNRQVYLSERELNLIHVKMKNIEINIRELTKTNTSTKRLKELRDHKALINGKLNGFITKLINHCGANRYQDQSPSSTSSKKTVSNKSKLSKVAWK